MTAPNTPRVGTLVSIRRLATMFRKDFLLIFLLGALISVAQDVFAVDNSKFSGLIKFQSALNAYDNKSYYNRFGDSPQEQHNLDARLMYQQQRGEWDWQVHYQVALKKTKLPPDNFSNLSASSDADKHRLWNLTRKIKPSNRVDNIHRIDRLYLRYSVDQWVAKIGRQAISWGHGQFFNPLDIANPFDPVLIDKEYKSGDDMAYLQWLQQNGNDLQIAVIPRRDDNGMVQSEQSTFAVKYRGLWRDLDYDLLTGRHYGENIVGFGANIPWHDSNINSDWLVSKLNPDSDRPWALIANIGISYSWTWWNKNIFGRAEFLHNGFGIAGSPMDAAQIDTNTELLKRLLRGELYTLAKNYLATGLNIELHPLLTLDINTFINLHDPSALLQILGQYNQSDNSNISAGLISYIGADGSEYGGIEILPSQYYSRQYSLFAKYTYYF